MARILTSVAMLLLFLAPPLKAQYKDYPQASGKVQPLTIPAIPSWVDFDMDLRGRGEGQTSVNYIGGNAQDYFLTRARGSMQLRPAPWLTGYIQFMDTHALGLPLKYTASNMRDNFDIRQAWVDFHGGPVSAYAGRFELKYGDERIIGISDWTNNSRTFDGFLVRLGDRNNPKANFVDIFSTSVVVVHPTALDMHAGGLAFSGIYGSINALLPRATIEPYILMKALPSVSSQQKELGAEREFTPGLYLSNNAPAGFDYTLNGNFQRGSYSNDSIHSGSGLVKLGYTATHIPWSPRLQGEYDYATGNTHRNPQRISTYDQQYPSNHNAFGLVDLFGYQNIRQERINLSLTPHPHITVLIQQEWLNLATRHDSLYSGSGGSVVKAPSGGFATDSIGRGFDASMKYVIHDYWVINAGVGHFSPGQFMALNAHGAPLTLSYLGLTYRFRLQHSNPDHP
jgi:hypothetical protein